MLKQRGSMHRKDLMEFEINPKYGMQILGVFKGVENLMSGSATRIQIGFDEEQAEKEFLQAVRLNPRYNKAQYNLAVALFNQKRYADAAKAYFKARDLDREYVNRRDNSEHTRKKLQAALEQAAEDEESSRELKRMQKWLAPN